LLGETSDNHPVEFTHVIELCFDDEEIRLRAEHLRVDPTDGKVYSKWEREERKKPKPVVDEDEVVEEEENEVKPLDELSLVRRICDTEEKIRDELNYYNSMERPAMEELFLPLFDSQYIKIDAAGLKPDELLNISSLRIAPDANLPLRPIAKQIENGSDFKSLLTEDLKENELPRKWSYWKTTDPVALFNGKLIPGSPEFAASFHHNVFVFSSEENMKSFIEEPKKYLLNEPRMPPIYRVLMLGPNGVGKHT